ncbi:hypothetical protein EIP91_003788 [Steccherinum ochraceum]|uniref:DUF6593 domain-containing protein n=1 Tax=Steccherinum ochraceum TaxID=92696 RepID=A0A4R0RQJ1_9APHY|nr:hypothetical protein EIP91_003788 [Steccherinum ochraceum]
MNLYLVPNDINKTVIMTADGVAKYRVATRRKFLVGPPLSQIYRCATGPDSEDTLIGEVEWKRWSHPVVRSDRFDGTMREMELKDFLYKLGRNHSTTRYFLGSNDKEYCWNTVKGVGCVLSDRNGKKEIARLHCQALPDAYTGQEKWHIKVNPTSLDLDMIIITFVIVEKRRREQDESDKDDVEENPFKFESGFDGGVGGGGL